MTVTRLQLQQSIYQILAKEPTAYGLLTPTKVNETIQDSLDFIASVMLGLSSMWNVKTVFLDINKGDHYIPLPADMAIVNYAKKKSNPNDTAYAQIPFIETNKETMTEDISVPQNGVPESFRFSDNKIYLEPLPQADIKNTYGTLVMQDLTYTSKVVGSLVNNISVQYTGGAIAGSEVVSVVGNVITVQIQSGVSTATQVSNAINNSVYATNLVSVAISGVGANAQVVQAATSLTGGSAGGFMLVYIAYPNDLLLDSSPISGDMNYKTLIQYAKWRSARILHQMANDTAPAWASTEIEWYNAVLKLIAKRSAMPVIVPGVQV